MLHLKVWSDFDCPYCYISKHQLKKELNALGVKDYDLELLPYQLSPEKFNEPERTFFDALELTNEKDIQRVNATFKKIEDLALTVGLKFNLHGMRSVNTALAHKLCLWARDEAKDKVNVLIEKIFYAQFCLNEDISKKENLVRYAISSGYNESRVGLALCDKSYDEKLEAYLELSYEEDIELIPHYYLPKNKEFAGIPPVNEMIKRLREALA